jgi:D-alanyl-D-alanine carboxypeptidase
VRYPEGKQQITGYKYEPWHIRFVGKELASKVYKKGITLEEYYNDYMQVDNPVQ